MCLKFQLIRKSALLIVAKAMCKQSGKLVCPTTFSVIYSVAKSTASSLVSKNSVFLTLSSLTNVFIVQELSQVPLL